MSANRREQLRFAWAWHGGRAADGLTRAANGRRWHCPRAASGCASAAGDEPTASLDAEAADEVIALLTSVVAERQATLVCVVHDLDLVPRLAEARDCAAPRASGGGPARHGEIAAELRGILKE